MHFRQFIQTVCLFIVGLYKICTVNNRKRCRFVPSCSDYTYEAINKYGVCKGVRLGIKRIFSCHCLSKKCAKTPYDPVP